MLIFKVNDTAATIPLGVQGENHARQVRFPIAEWLRVHGSGGTFRLVHRRNGDDVPYMPSVSSDGEYVYWPLTSTDTANAGIGRAELSYITDGGVVAKSHTYVTRTEPAVGADACAKYLTAVAMSRRAYHALAEKDAQTVYIILG